MEKSQREKQKREWHLLDAQGQILGRLSTFVAELLRGKRKIEYVPYKDVGDYVIIKNARKVKLTGKKLEQKVYYRHSGYLGNLRKTSAKELLRIHPEEIIRHAVSGMLPNNKLKKLWLKRLYIYPGEEHSYKDKLSETIIKRDKDND